MEIIFKPINYEKDFFIITIITVAVKCVSG